LTLSGCSNHKVRDGKLVQVTYEHSTFYSVNYVGDHLYEHIDAAYHYKNGFRALTAVDGVITEARFFQAVWTREMLLKNPVLLARAKLALIEGRNAYLITARKLAFKTLVSSFPDIK